MAKEKTAESAQTPGTDVAAPGAKQSTAVAAQSSVSTDILMADAKVDLGFRAEDLAIPFLKIAQLLTPQAQKRDPSYIEGIEEGDFFNMATNERFPGGEGIVVVPITFTPSYTEWKPREDKGGLIKDHKTDDSLLAVAVRNDKNKLVLPNGNHLVQSAMYYVFLLKDIEGGTFEPVVLNMSGSQLKKARRWNSVIQSLQVENPNTKLKYRPAPFFKSYHITTVPEKNDRGAWMGYKIESGEDTLKLPFGDQIYLKAREMREFVSSGKARAKVEDLDLGDTPDAAQVVTKEDGDAGKAF